MRSVFSFLLPLVACANTEPRNEKEESIIVDSDGDGVFPMRIVMIQLMRI